jgi:hypothetical protein
VVEKELSWKAGIKSWGVEGAVNESLSSLNFARKTWIHSTKQLVFVAVVEFHVRFLNEFSGGLGSAPLCPGNRCAESGW